MFDASRSGGSVMALSRAFVEWSASKQTVSSSVLVATRWTDEAGRTRVRLLAADLPDANDITLDEDGARAWIDGWLKGPPQRS